MKRIKIDGFNHEYFCFPLDVRFQLLLFIELDNVFDLLHGTLWLKSIPPKWEGFA